MKRIVLAGVAVLIVTIAPLAAAHAQVTVRVSTPEFGIRIGAPAPRVVYPAPVYMPAPRVVMPAPIYLPPPAYAPAPHYYAPHPVIVRTVVVPAIGYSHVPHYAGARVAPGHFKHGKHRHRGHRWHR